MGDQNWPDRRCPRCRMPKEHDGHCWCSECHSVVICEMWTQLSLPALKLGVPGYSMAYEECEHEPTPPPKAFVGRKKRRAKFITASVDEALLAAEAG